VYRHGLGTGDGIAVTSLSKTGWSLAEDHLISPVRRPSAPQEMPAFINEREAAGTTKSSWTITSPAPNVAAEDVRLQRRQSRRMVGLKWLCLGGTLSWLALLVYSS
jgi:hypothetical protein